MRLFKRHSDIIFAIGYITFLFLWGGLIFHLSCQGMEWPEIPGGF